VLAFGALGIFLGPVLLGVGWMLIVEFTRPEPEAEAAPPIPAIP